jgi:signal peptidase II
MFLRGKWRNVVFFLTTLLVLAADQFTKMGIRTAPEGHLIFEKGIFRIIHVSNSGAIFGLFQGQTAAIIAMSSIGIVALMLYILFVCRHFSILDSILSRLALGLILGGALGNLIDRLRLGGVTDFISIGFWPAFNVADMAITAGIIVFAYALLRPVRAKKYSDG